MNCPKCGTMMSTGTSHAKQGEAQWECHMCGYYEIITCGGGEDGY